jgi:hypothetical protein
MKKILTLIFLLSILFFSACKKSEDTDDFVSMNINGSEWRDENGKTLINKNSGLLTVTGSTSKGTLTITVPNVTATGTFDMVLADGTPGFSYLDKTTGTSKIYSISLSKPRSRGTITVTKINPGNNTSFYGEGTFSGVAFTTNNDSIVITNGVFQEI